jgi:hypothetical protein
MADIHHDDISCASDYVTAMKNYDLRLQALTDERAKAQARLDAGHKQADAIDAHEAQEKLAVATQALTAELLQSPMHRQVGALYNEAIAQVSESSSPS